MERVESRGSTEATPDPKAIFEEFYEPVFYFFYRRGFSRDEARDLAQETFLEILRGLDGYRGDAPVGGWVMGVARNVFRNHLKSRHRIKRSAPEVSLETWLEEGRSLASELAPEQPLDHSLAEERGRLLRHAMASLSADQRDCVFLRVDQELPYREIAEVLQISMEAVKSRLFKAKQQLRETVGRHFEASAL